MLSKLRAFLFQDWIPKLTCLLIAVGLWFWVAIQQSGRLKFKVPVETVNKPSDVVVTNRNPRNVTLVLSGLKKRLYQTSASDLSARLNLDGQTPGTKVFWSSKLNIGSPEDLEVVDVVPRKIRVELARRSEKKVPVKPRVGNTPPEAYNYRLSVSPETATLLGSDEILREINRIMLTSIDLSGRDSGTETLQREAELPRRVQLIEPATNEFEVTVEVYQEQITRTVKDVPVTVKEIPAGMRARVEPSSMDLTVRGPRRTVESLQPSDITVNVDAPEKISSLVIRVADVTLPENVELVEGEEAVSAVKVKLESL